MIRSLPSRSSRGALIGAVAVVLSATAVALTNPVPVLTGLNAPRGLAVGPAGRLIYGEFNGAVSELIARGQNAGDAQLLNAVPATTVAAPAVGTLGGQIFVLTAQGAPGSGSNTLYRVTNGTVRALADIGAYQVIDPDPYNVTLAPDESNPFGVAPLPDGSVLVSDAAGNDLLRVYPDGDILTVARLKPRTVTAPGGAGPPAGTQVLSEAVATSVTVGADGYYYVGELRGVPATPGTSQVWRIAPNSVNAICDPLAPSSGPCQRYKDGFTSIVDLDAGSDGSIYVVELAKQSWLQWLAGLGGPPIGSVRRIAPNAGAVSELVPGQLLLPSGIAVTSDNAVYVTGPISPLAGPGAIKRIQ